MQSPNFPTRQQGYLNAQYQQQIQPIYPGQQQHQLYNQPNTNYIQPQIMQMPQFFPQPAMLQQPPYYHSAMYQHQPLSYPAYHNLYPGVQIQSQTSNQTQSTNTTMTNPLLKPRIKPVNTSSPSQIEGLDRTISFGQIKEQNLNLQSASKLRASLDLSTEPRISVSNIQSQSFQSPQFVHKLSDFSEQQKQSLKMSTAVHFQVNCKTQFNEHVAIVGSAPSLGNWDFKKAVSLTTSDQTYPNWNVDIELPRDSTIEYKYIKVSNQEEVVWEELSGNRVVNTHGRARINIQEEFSNQYKSEEAFKDEHVNIWERERQVFPPINVSPNLYLSMDDSSQEKTPSNRFTMQRNSVTSADFDRKNDLQNRSQITHNQMPLGFHDTSLSAIDRDSPPERKVSHDLNELQLKLNVVQPEFKQKVKYQSPKASQESFSRQADDAKFANRNQSSHDDSELDITSQEFMKQQLQKAFKDYKYNADRVIDKYSVGIAVENIENDSLSSEEAVFKKIEHAKKNPSFEDDENTDIKIATRRKTDQLEHYQQHSQKHQPLDPDEPIIQCTFYLPYKLQVNPKKPDQFIAHQCYHNPTFLYGLMDNMAQQKTYNFIWIGIISTQHKFTEYEEKLANEALIKKNCYAIYLTAEELEPFMQFYEGLLRPRMHNFFDPFHVSQQAVNYWSKYNEVCMKVAAKVNEVRLLHPTLTMVWVNGDHLMMCPYYIRQKFEKANIGFYFHSSFPASSIFASFYRRNEILQSLLCSDLVSFHLFEYARNFLNSCHRLFGLQYQFGVGGALSIILHGRAIQVSVKHIGIDEGFIMHMRSSHTYRSNEKQFKEEFKEIAKLAQRSFNNANPQPIVTLANSRSHAFFNEINLNNGNRMLEELPSGSVSTSGSSVDLQNLVDGQALMSAINRQRANVNNNQRPVAEKPIIIASIDSFHQMAGIKQKLKAYQQFLRDYEDYRNKVVLIQFIPSILCLSDNLPNQGHPGEETKETTTEKKFKVQQQIVESIPVMKELQADIKQVIKEIHYEFGQHSLVMMDTNPSLEKRLAIWSQTQILLVSTLKDGLCLPPLEFATVKKLNGEYETSGMILSEFSGCSSAFNGFHSYNPFDSHAFGKALDTCLSQSSKKKSAMMRKAYKQCTFTTFNAWVQNFLTELKESYNPNKHAETRYIYLGLSTVDCMKAQQQVTKSPNMKLPQPLNTSNFNSDFNQSTRSLIIINHEALPCVQYGKQHLTPLDQTIEYLSEISQDSRNIVCVFSNEEKKTVQKAFRKLPNVWLAAESGYWYKTDKSDWQRLFKQDSKVWLRVLRKIFDQYCENIEGSCVDERESTIAWNYKNAAEEHGLKFSKELYNQVTSLIGNNAPVQIIQGNGFIEVLPTQLKKEKLMKLILKHVKARSDRKIDFLLFIGCDPRDERSFQYFKRKTQQIESQNEYFSSDCKTRLCIIGKKPSNADYYIDSESQVAHLIQKLGQNTQSRKRNRSYSNLLNFNRPHASFDSLTGSNQQQEIREARKRSKRKDKEELVNLQQIDEEQDDNSTVHITNKDGENITSPTHSYIESQMKQFSGKNGIERHESQGTIGAKFEVDKTSKLKTQSTLVLGVPDQSRQRLGSEFCEKNKKIQRGFDDSSLQTQHDTNLLPYGDLKGELRKAARDRWNN